jgi:hypothetical protein
VPEVARFVSVSRFAQLVSLSERTCWSLIRGRLIPVYRVGRRTLVKTEEGFQALERLAVKSVPSASRSDGSARKASASAVRGTS